MISLLHHDTPFPPVTQALHQPNGLLAAGGDLMPERLLDAYRQGIFPWFSAGDPILWWSPDPRMVLFPEEFKISKSLRKTLHKGKFEVRTDSAFEQVMRACALPREGQDGTWIQEEIIAAYVRLHKVGLAHSVETWMEGELVGGLYGVSLGRMFYGESMFSRKTDASKIALAHLTAQLKRWEFGMIDCQMNTPHLASMGAREISRREFILRLQELIHYPDIESFRFDHDLFA
ncbi:MAG: leucyl/phenylalanyl-tRNA--protein transferase [Gallionellales bacterium 35-53-114]|jgi:leucyl/phenylalanyl-tRNA--protein transferase|nr:MAG: leucyl/phenylalanyl-tRNA--protein transferase [Gallionellales bacterium 35-53-114]OYZ62277.1 MAG: leucyl/phenylalanyl-tRNA--protein transferase [Gallionellales bacterium 24-53-125]OZB10600.1 MAG: leucyl/phenylalanyl-tRNA--protein transferase [Gallionellales bacterium 39-52-133]HQS57233.1 leucyl/phenylalanyl-tRNA--protein transferase [Gallionellaceae bacterium]HQS74579.1 leucyl/phenylalanyl-tRNA--protein transferase [Gallionellaceae bacterium]